MAHQAERGTTLLELVVAVTILAGVLLVVFTMMRTGQDTFTYGVNLAATETRARQAVDEVVLLLVDSGASQLVPDLEVVTYSSSLEFRKNAGMSAGVIQWGPAHRVEYQQDPGDPEDGVDNDRDGLVDEGRLVWTRDVGEAGERSTVLAGSVAARLEGEVLNGADDNGNGMVDERGFCLRRSGNQITIYLSLQSWDGKFGLLEATVRTAVRLRN